MAKRSRESDASSDIDMSDYSEATSPAGAASPTTTLDSEPPAKIQHLDPVRPAVPLAYVKQCHLPGHTPLSFQSYSEYDVHVLSNHMHHCTECLKNFPTEHYMNLHIAENHDPFNEIRRDRGEKTYKCFVEDCDRVCSTAMKRRRHAIDKHGFHKFYDFSIVNDGLERRSTMLRPHPSTRHRSFSKTTSTSSKEKEFEVETTNRESEDKVSALTNTMSALKFVPSSVKLGSRHGMRGGFAKQ